MKVLSTALVALLATTAVAMAGDLPNKKKAPAAAPVAAATAAVAAATSSDSLTVAYGQDLANNFGSKSDDIYALTYKHSFGFGFSGGFQAQTTSDTSNVVKQNLEAQAGYALPSFSGVAVSGKLGVGERFVSTGNFPYYAVYGNADYKVMDGLTLNAVQYRYRSAIDTNTYGYISHQIGTGATYAINSTYSVSGKIFRNYDSGLNATGDGFQVGLTANF